ncbi:MAG: RdgB/HAM1 family non-canonical purine NTP pyrophosphatase [Beijerinckiaceae bacterium]|nr:RdgB/HAM1 family non-canonical purine NTP pyrophosphatase [Beijerinckiaceae bacterium]
MSRHLEGTFVVATHNKGKLREIEELVAPFGLHAVSAASLNLPEPVEDGDTFIANALIKARAAAFAAKLPALADDSGICVAALDGAPGIYSARWAGESKDFGHAMEKVEAGLRERDCVTPAQRKAWFISALALVWPDGHEEIVEGRVDGTLVWPPRGAAGFGYDPMFLPDGETRTFGEMTSEEKHGLPPLGKGLSHRARAFIELAERCLKR